MPIRQRLFLSSIVLVPFVLAQGFARIHVTDTRERERLQQVLSDLDKSDPRWRLADLEAARPSVSDKDNSVRIVLAAHRLMSRGALDWEVMKQFSKLPPERPELLGAKRAAVLKKELDSLAAAILEARKLADMPAGRHLLTVPRNPLKISRTDRIKTRDVSNLLRYDALSLAQKGEVIGALHSARALFNAARSFGDEPFDVSQLIRIAGVSMAAGAVERTLALGEPPVKEVARLQILVEQEEAHPTLLVMLQGDRALHHEMYTKLADGRLGRDEGDEDIVSGMNARHPLSNIKDAICRDHRQFLEWMNRAIANARLPDHEQITGEKVLRKEIDKLPTGYLKKLALPAYLQLAVTCRRKRASMRCLMVLLSLERYRLENNAWPAKLLDLTPKLLKTVPPDPFDGKPIRYKKLADGVVVYSVDRDGKDDGGRIVSVPPDQLASDVGFRLWDVKHRRQPPRPEKPR